MQYNTSSTEYTTKSLLDEYSQGEKTTLDIARFEIFKLALPLNFSFKSSQAEVNFRETLIIKVMDTKGRSGYGEVVAFTEPFYTKETLASSFEQITKVYIPELFENSLCHPFELHKFFPQKENSQYAMGLAGLENALLDLYAKRKQENLMTMLFPKRRATHVDVGLVFGESSFDDICQKIEDNYKLGCQRFKLKIRPDYAYEVLKEVRRHFKKIQLAADANKSFKQEEWEELYACQEFKLRCIEEPFNIEALEEYRGIKPIKSPICLDESVLLMEDLEYCFKYSIGDVFNIKIGRLGGLFYTRKMIEMCREKRKGFWIGSMLESGISKILHVQLASLLGTYMAGDLSDSSRYFKEDIIYPAIISEKGKIPVPEKIGLGVEVKEDLIQELSSERFVFRAKNQE